MTGKEQGRVIQSTARQSSRKQESAKHAPSVTQPPIATIVRQTLSGVASPTADDVLQLQRAVGNRAVGRLLASREGSIQTRLAVGAADDPYEREADRVASQVLSDKPLRADVSRQEDDDFAQRTLAITTLVQRRGVDDLSGSFEAGRGIERQLSAGASGGNALPPKLRSELEPKFGVDFNKVRVHTGSHADSLNRALGAQAFTHGSHIYLGEGKYNPESTSGKRLLAHELTHVVQQDSATTRRSSNPIARRRVTPAIQRARTALTTKEILNALNGIPFISEKLKTDIQKQKMEARLSVTMKQYKQHFGKKETDNDTRDAMMLAMSLDSVARVIAEEVGDITVQSEIAIKLFEEYRPEIETQIGRQKRSLRKTNAQAPLLTLTKTLLEGNPVTQYMHRELRKDDAAKTIIKMATTAGMTNPLDMYNLMEQRFQAQMAAYTQEQLHEDDVTARFSTREAHGEYSKYFFAQLFGDNSSDKKGAPKWNAGGKTSSDRLAFTGDTETRLTELKNEIQHPTVARIWVPRDTKLNPKQEQHLGEIEEAEALIDKTSVKAQFVDLFKQRYGLIDVEADALYTKVLNVLTSAPFTITVQSDKWFGGTTTPSPEFNPAAAKREQMDYSTLFRKTGAKGQLDFVKRWNDEGLKEEEKRGPNYMRFRIWKDRLMTGNLGFKPEEMPSFGALNINWETSKGGDDPNKHGSNYYGDLHFKMNRDAVKNRLIYTASDHGQPRRDPLFALHDFAFGGKGLTWLKDTKKLGVVDNIVNAAQTKKPIYGLALLFEVQVFGGVNIKRDCDEAFLASTIKDPVKQAIIDYFNGTGVTVTTLGDKPPDAVSVEEGDVQSLVANLLAEGMLTVQQKREVGESTENLPSHVQQIPPMAISGLQGAYAGGFKIMQTLLQYGDTMGTSDFSILTQQLETLTKKVALPKTIIANFAKDPEKTKGLLTGQIKACTEAPGKVEAFLLDVAKAIRDKKTSRSMI